jgi:hypothetical protein
MRLTSAEPVPANLAWQYEHAIASSDYVRHPTVVICSGCCGAGCQLCEPEPAPTPSRLRRLAALLRKER